MNTNLSPQSLKKAIIVLACVDVLLASIVLGGPDALVRRIESRIWGVMTPVPSEVASVTTQGTGSITGPDLPAFEPGSNPTEDLDSPSGNKGLYKPGAPSSAQLEAPVVPAPRPVIKHVADNRTSAAKLQHPLPGSIGYSISGRVVDITNRPVAGVVVAFNNIYTATTNASGYYSLTSLVTDTYAFTPSKALFGFSPAARSASVSGSTAGQDFVVVPDIGFRPDRDGYKFANPGHADPDCAALQRSFSGLKIDCSNGQPQKEYLALFERFKFAFRTGTCTGMAATSLAYYVKSLGIPQSAASASVLNPEQAWPTIATLHGRQYSKAVLDRLMKGLAPWDTKDPAVISKRVDEVYQVLRSAVQPGNPDPVVLDLVPRPGCDTPGHTVTPYRLDESDPQRPKVYIYENFAPGDLDKFIQFDFTGTVHQFTYWQWDSNACSALVPLPLSSFTGPEDKVPSSYISQHS